MQRFQISTRNAKSRSDATVFRDSRIRQSSPVRGASSTRSSGHGRYASLRSSRFTQSSACQNSTRIIESSHPSALSFAIAARNSRRMSTSCALGCREDRPIGRSSLGFSEQTRNACLNSFARRARSIRTRQRPGTPREHLHRARGSLQILKSGIYAGPRGVGQQRCIYGALMALSSNLLMDVSA
jgi:hypothetical protein